MVLIAIYLAFGLGFYLGAALMQLEDMVKSYKNDFRSVWPFITGALAGILIWPIMVAVVAYHQYMDYQYARVIEEFYKDDEI